MDQQQVKLEKDEDKQEMERELKDLVSAAGKSRKKHKNQVLCLTYSWRWSIVFPNPSGLDLEASLYCANIFAKPRQIAEERPYQGFPYEYIVMFYICFKVISYTIIFDLVLLVPFQSRHIPVFHPVGPGLHIETPGKVDGEQPRAASAPGEGRSLMADFNKERGVIQK